MGIQRKDLTDKKGLYSLPGREGIWKVHKGFEMPSIQMVNIESGELHDMRMDSMDNIRSKLVRMIGDDEKIAAPYEVQEVEKLIEKKVPVDKTPEKLVEAKSQIDMMREIITDALSLVGDLLADDEVNGVMGKEHRVPLSNWHDQVGSVAADWEGEPEEEQPESAEQKQIAELQLMVLDASVLVGEVYQVDRPKKQQKEKMRDWCQQYELSKGQRQQEYEHLEESTELTDDQGQIMQLINMVNDAAAMLNDVLAVDRPKKEQKDQLKEWFDQIEQISSDWSQLPENLQHDID